MRKLRDPRIKVKLRTRTAILPFANNRIGDRDPMEGLLSAEFGIPDNDLVPSSAGRRLAGASLTLGVSSSSCPVSRSQALGTRSLRGVKGSRKPLP